MIDALDMRSFSFLHLMIENAYKFGATIVIEDKKIYLKKINGKSNEILFKNSRKIEGLKVNAGDGSCKNVVSRLVGDCIKVRAKLNKLDYRLYILKGFFLSNDMYVTIRDDRIQINKNEEYMIAVLTKYGLSLVQKNDVKIANEVINVVKGLNKLFYKIKTVSVAEGDYFIH